jgi:hypothetical protein
MVSNTATISFFPFGMAFEAPQTAVIDAESSGAPWGLSAARTRGVEEAKRESWRCTRRWPSWIIGVRKEGKEEWNW